MKQTLILALLISGSLMSSAQRGRENVRTTQRQQPPQPVQQAFRKDNPQANARWSQNNNQWHAQYKDNQHGNKTAQSYYEPGGRHIDTHVLWDRKQLPHVVDTRIYSRYHTRDYKVYRIERPNNVSLFQIILNIGGGNRTVYVDENGNEVQYEDMH